MVVVIYFLFFLFLPFVSQEIVQSRKLLQILLFFWANCGLILQQNDFFFYWALTLDNTRHWSFLFQVFEQTLFLNHSPTTKNRVSIP